VLYRLKRFQTKVNNKIRFYISYTLARNPVILTALCVLHVTQMWQTRLMEHHLETPRKNSATQQLITARRIFIRHKYYNRQQQTSNPKSSYLHSDVLHIRLLRPISICVSQHSLDNTVE